MNTPTTEQLLESFRLYTERLSSSEKKKRRLKALHPGYSTPDEIIPKDMKKLANGIVSDSNNMHDLDGRFADSTTNGSYSDNGKQGERRGKIKGASRAPCGRRKSSSGRKYKCKDGTLREDDLNSDNNIDAAYIKAIVEKSVNQAVRAAMASVQKETGCSLQQCLRIVNQLNQAEDGDLGKKKKKNSPS